MTQTTVTSRGQIVIPENIREEMGIETGFKLNVYILNGKIIMEPINHKAKINNFRKKVRQHLQSNNISNITNEEISKSIEELWTRKTK